MDYCIWKLLGLTEKNFIIDENWLETVTENHKIVHSEFMALLSREWWFGYQWIEF